MDRIYNDVVKQHLSENQQMVFLSGPRQVGKTTIGRCVKPLTNEFLYLNWDDLDDRLRIIEGPRAITSELSIHAIEETLPIVMLDEIHKYPKWKNFLKGFYDRFYKQVRIVVTGSARLDIYRKGGDSLMGRYFPYRIHPLSVREIINTKPPSEVITVPKKLERDIFQQLFQFGGFPEPFLKHNVRFSQRWQRLRNQQLFSEDIRELSAIHDIHRMELLAHFIAKRSATEMNFSSYAKQIRVSVDTVARWIEILQGFYYCFMIRPWSRNITRSLLKEPKVYLWDWAQVIDSGARAENFIASHLLKATHFWTDQGFGDFGLYYLRDLEKREVDFIITRDDEPWFLVEVKFSAKNSLNPSLAYFQKITGAKHAFQVAIDKPYVHVNCFDYYDPVIVPAITFLSQLI